MPSASTFPIVELNVAGNIWDDSIRSTLSELRVHRRLSLPAMCELVFLGNPPGKIKVNLDDELKIAVGHQPLFWGEVTAIEYVYGVSNSRELHIRAFDRLHRLRKRQSVLSIVDKRLDEIVRELISIDRLSVQCSSLLPVLRNAVQWRDSDFDYLVGLTARFGIYFGLKETTVYLTTLASDSTPIPVRLGANLLRAQFEKTNDSSCSKVRALAWDPSLANEITATADSAQTGRTTVWRASGFLGTERFLLNQIVEDDAQAQLAAQGELNRRVGREFIFSGISEGDPNLLPGARVSVTDVAPELCDTYTLTQVVHRIDGASGFVSEFSTEPPLDPEIAPPTASLGVVTNVDDPKRLGRVRVKLVGYRDAESGWLAVVTPGAGSGKGIIALPNTGDRVLLFEPAGDPANAIVIGGLYGASAPPDSVVENGRVQRFTIQTPAPHKLSFDDATKTIRLEDATGNHIALSPNGFMLHSAADLRIEAPGRAIKIIADKIDFERG